MKPLLIALICLGCYSGFTQDSTYIQKLLKGYTFTWKKGTWQDSLKLMRKSPADTSTTLLNRFKYDNNMPNAFTGTLPKPKLIGNNGKGQNIYELPLDRMPLLKPDSTFRSNMPVAGKTIPGLEN